MRIWFLGVGGGRLCLARGTWKIGGLFVEPNLLVDPGPDAPEQLRRKRLMGRIRRVFLSHFHFDHVAGLPAVAEAIGPGASLFGSPKALQVFPYHSGLFKRRKTMEWGEEAEGLRATRADHTPFSLGMVMGGFGYTGDTHWFPEMKEEFCDLEVLVANYHTHRTNYWGHLDYDGILALARSCRPKLLVLTHYGARVKDPKKVAEAVSKRTGVLTLAAKTGWLLDTEELEI